MDQWEIEVAQILSVLAAIYRDKDVNVKVYLAVLRKMNLTVEDIAKAADIWMNNANNLRFPLPAQLKAAIRITDEQLARDAVSRIVECLSNCSGNEQRAKEKIGEIGWRVVQRMGGWNKLTYSRTDELGPTAQAQWRELALTFINQVRVGAPDTPPMFPNYKNTEGKNLQSLGNLMKSIAHKPESS